jgi:predicted membrane metal-binding protein
MTEQHLVVFALVAACSIYALWVLMPTVARRFMAKHLAQLPIAAAWKARLQRAATASSGCDCSGCDRQVDLQRKAQPQVVHFQARPKD